MRGGHWVGVWQSGRLGEAPLTYSDVTCGVTDFLKTTKKRPEPFLPLASRVSANQSGDNKWGHGRLAPQGEKKKNNKRKTCRGFKRDKFSTLWFPPKHRKKGTRRPAPSACWVKTIRKGRGGGLLWVKGMKVRLTGDYTVSQSVGACRAQTTCSFVWHKLTTPQHISLRSQQQ